MKIPLTISVFALLFGGISQMVQAGQHETRRRRGKASVEETRPAQFPHRIWVAADFEGGRLPNYAWFGTVIRKGIPDYPGNFQTLRSHPGSHYVGINPVPGPCMGKVNKMYCRYLLEGTTQAQFQHYSLSSNDNNHIRVSGLTEGRWSEVTLNFSRDGKRNDGTPGVPFKSGERMDDLKIFFAPKGKAAGRQMTIDDVIFFAEDPGLPPEPEPFPRRVMFLMLFDTGIDPKSRSKYHPGLFDPVFPSRAPKGSYWVVAKAVDKPSTASQHVYLEMKPPRFVGPNTRLRFRYWVKGASKIKVVLHDATDRKDRVLEVKDPRQGQWVTQYLTFSRDAKFVRGGSFAIGNKVDSVAFIVPSRRDVQLYVDEPILYDAYLAK